MRRVLVALAVTGAVLTALAVLVWFAQRPMLYLAGGTPPAQPPPGIRAVTLTTEDGLELGAWWVPAEEPRAVAVVLPGNAGTRANREPLGRTLAELGMSALLVDYRGYAGNPGRPSEPGLRADARAARQWLDAAAPGDVPVFYVGESLGAAVAAGLASEQPPDGLLLRSPFPSLADVAAAAYGLPAVPELVLRDRYPVARQLAGLDTVAVAVLAGAEDRIVPPRLSVEVAEAAGVIPRIVDAADHNDPDWLDGAPLRETVEHLLDATGGPEGNGYHER